MKKIYFLPVIAFFMQQQMQAQLTLTKAAYEPVSGDVFVAKQFDSTTVVPKSTGSGQTWDFTSFSANTVTESVTYTTASSAPGGSLFPSANLAELKGTETGYHNTSGSNWEFLGFYDTNGPTITNFTNTGIMAVWPVAFGNTNADAFSGTSTSGTNTSSWTGNVSYTAAGTGTVILPGGIVHPNCLQYILTVSITVVSGTNTSTYLEKAYSYYSAAQKYPIVEYSYDASTSGTVTSQGFDLHVSVAALNVGANEYMLTSQQVLVFPNPAKGWVNISVDGNSSVEWVEVMDLTGKVMVRSYGSTRVDLSALRPSLYFLRIKTGNSVVVKRIAVED